MIALIERLQAGPHVPAEGSVYFRIASFPEYGRLARLDVAGIQAGARVDTDKYDKENARDFVLWKFKERRACVGAVGGAVREGPAGLAHRVLAMSMKYLGETFDLHAGARTSFPAPRERDRPEHGGTGKPSRGTGCTSST